MFTKWHLILLLLFSMKAHAQEIILIQGPGSSTADFTEVAQATKGLQTILDIQVLRIQNNSRQEERLFSIGEQLHRPTSDLVQEIEKLHQEAAWTDVSLNFLNDLSEKILSTPLKTAEATFFRDLSCQSQLLTEDVTNAACKTTAIDFTSIRRQWPMAQALLIESKLISLEDTNAAAMIIPTGIYHWTLLSNSAQSISFYGTYEHFLQQRLVMENWVDGTCEGFSAKVDDFQIVSNALVFFSKDCTKRLHRPVQKTSFAEWIDQNKKWVYPLGGLLIGGAIFTAAGKTLVIDKP